MWSATSVNGTVGGDGGSDVTVTAVPGTVVWGAVVVDDVPSTGAIRFPGCVDADPTSFWVCTPGPQAATPGTTKTAATRVRDATIAVRPAFILLSPLRGLARAPPLNPAFPIVFVLEDAAGRPDSNTEQRILIGGDTFTRCVEFNWASSSFASLQRLRCGSVPQPPYTLRTAATRTLGTAPIQLTLGGTATTQRLLLARIGGCSWTP